MTDPHQGTSLAIFAYWRGDSEILPYSARSGIFGRCIKLEHPDHSHLVVLSGLMISVAEFANVCLALSLTTRSPLALAQKLFRLVVVSIFFHHSLSGYFPFIQEIEPFLLLWPTATALPTLRKRSKTLPLYVLEAWPAETALPSMSFSS